MTLLKIAILELAKVQLPNNEVFIKLTNFSTLLKIAIFELAKVQFLTIYIFNFAFARFDFQRYEFFSDAQTIFLLTLQCNLL